MLSILIVEDDATTALILFKSLRKNNYDVDVTHNGNEALKALRKKSYEIVITDWMMPVMDGVELIQNIREHIDPVPGIIMLTAVDSAGSREQAMSAGADDFLTKPLQMPRIVECIEVSRSRRAQAVPETLRTPATIPNVNAPFVGVGIAASTGGPPTLNKLVEGLSSRHVASYFITQHGPDWLAPQLVQQIQRHSKLNVRLAEDGAEVVPGEIIVAPGEQHMQVDSKSLRIMLSDGPPENFVRPAADPMFRSLARAFGKKSIGVVLTGLGCDGTNGSAHIAAAGGQVFIQEPEECVARYMPQSVARARIRHKALPIGQMAQGLGLGIAQRQ